MALVVDPPVVVSDSIITNTITVHSQLHICTDGSTSSNYEEYLSFDKSIYRILSSQNDMKFLEYPDRIRNEFDLFLQYGERVDSGEVIASFAPLDEYLGSIGVSNGIC